MGQSANLVAQRALDALKRSSRERSAHHISGLAHFGGFHMVKGIFLGVQVLVKAAMLDMLVFPSSAF